MDVWERCFARYPVRRQGIHCGLMDFREKSTESKIWKVSAEKKTHCHCLRKSISKETVFFFFLWKKKEILVPLWLRTWKLAHFWGSICDQYNFSTQLLDVRRWVSNPYNLTASSCFEPHRSILKVTRTRYPQREDKTLRYRNYTRGDRA